MKTESQTLMGGKGVKSKMSIILINIIQGIKAIKATATVETTNKTVENKQQHCVNEFIKICFQK